MKYSLLVLLVSVVACQQPTSTSFNAPEDRLKPSFSIQSTPEIAPSASGIVTWTNRPGHAGKITTADGSVFTYNVRAGHTVNGYVPAVGDAVLFSTNTGSSARKVRPVDVAEDPDDDDGDDNPPPPPPPPLW